MVKYYREQHNYTQAYVAAKLGVSQSVYSKIENGKSKIFDRRAKQLAAILEIKARKETLFSNEFEIGFNKTAVDELKDKVDRLSLELNDLRKFIQDLHQIVSNVK